jgi:hypothetical protein
MMQNVRAEVRAERWQRRTFTELKNIESRVAWFLAELFKAKKGRKLSSHLCSSSG